MFYIKYLHRCVTRNDFISSNRHFWDTKHDTGYLGQKLMGRRPHSPLPRAISAFKMAGGREERTAGHVSPKILEILIVLKWRRARDWLILWSRDLLFARVFFALPFWTPRRLWGRGWHPVSLRDCCCVTRLNPSAGWSEIYFTPFQTSFLSWISVMESRAGM